MRYTSGLVLGALGLLGCGDDGDGDGGSGGSGTTTSSSSATSGSTSGTTSAATGSTSTDMSTGASMCLMFGSDCELGASCCDAAGQTGVCYTFGMGDKCTIPCPPNPADCPNNGAGCNNMNPSYCKAP